MCPKEIPGIEVNLYGCMKSSCHSVSKTDFPDIYYRILSKAKNSEYYTLGKLNVFVLKFSLLKRKTIRASLIWGNYILKCVTYL